MEGDVKKFIPYIVAVIVVLGGAGVWFAVTNSSKKSTDNASTASADDSKQVARKYSDACKVFTKEELTSALGGTYGDGEGEETPSSGTPGTDDYDELRGSMCTFKQDNDGSTAGMTAALDFSLTINNYASTDSADSFMKELHNPPTAEGQAAINKITDVAGAGDQAFFVVVASANGVADKTEALYVRAGKQILVLNATKLAGLDHTAVQTGLTTLAKKL